MARTRGFGGGAGVGVGSASVAANVVETVAAAETVVLWVTTSGSDSTGDGSVAKPYRTVVHANDTISKFLGKRSVVVDATGITETMPDGYTLPSLVSSSTYSFPEEPTTPAFSFNLSYTLRATPTVLLTPTVSSWADRGKGLQTLTVTDTMTVNAFKGKTLLSSTGAYAAIRSNGVHTLVLATTTPMSGTLTVVQDSCVLTSAGDGPAFAVQCDHDVAFQGIQFVNTGFGALTIRQCHAFYALACDIGSLEVNKASDGSLSGCYVRPGAQTYFVESCTINADNSFLDNCGSWRHYGSGGGQKSSWTACVFDGFPVGHVGGATENAFALANCEVVNSSSSAVAVAGGGCTIADCLIDAATADGILLTNNADVDISGSVTGTNGGVGIRGLKGHATISSGVLVTGAGGDMVVGNNAARSYTHFRGTAPIGSEVDFGPQFGTGASITEGSHAGASIPAASQVLTINTRTASYTLVLADGTDTYVQMNVASANNLTVPPNSSVAFRIGTQIPGRQIGAGQTTIVAGAGVTITTPETLLLRKQNSSFTLIKTGTNTWDLAGDLQGA